jgi:hypothetical protein
MGAPLSCANHLEEDAQFFCPRCDKHLCTACSKHIWAATGFVDQCLACDALLQKIGEPVRAPGARAGAVVADSGAAAFIERLPEILRYPIQPSVLLTLLGLTLLVAPLEWAGGQPGNMFWIFAVILVWGLKTSTYFHMIQRTANGSETMESPDFDNLFDDFLWPVLLILLASLPLLVGIFWYGEERFGVWEGGFLLLLEPTDIFNYPIPMVLVILGFALLPLLTAIAALSHSALSVVNPRLWIESLRAMAGTYPIAVAAFYGVVALDIFIYSRVLLEISYEIDVPILTRLLITLLAFLPMALKARILGGLCRPYLKDFDE